MAAQPFFLDLVNSAGAPNPGQAAALNAGAAYVNAVTLAAVTTGLPVWQEVMVPVGGVLTGTGTYQTAYDSLANPPLFVAYLPSGSVDATTAKVALLSDAARIAAIQAGATLTDLQIVQDVQSALFNAPGTFTQQTAGALAGPAAAGSLLATATKLAGHALGKFTYNPATNVLTLLADDGVTALGTVTLTIANGTITARQ